MKYQKLIFDEFPSKPEKPDGTDIWNLTPSFLNFKTTNRAKRVTYTKMHLFNALPQS